MQNSAASGETPFPSRMAVVEFLQTIGAQWQTILIASAILLVVYVLWGVIGCQSGSTRYGDVPGPRPLPLLGNTIDLLRHKGQIYVLIDEYYKKYGKVFTMRSFGPHPNLVVGDPEMLKDIFVKEFDSFSDRPVSSVLSFTPIALFFSNKRKNFRAVPYSSHIHKQAWIVVCTSLIYDLCRNLAKLGIACEQALY